MKSSMLALALGFLLLVTAIHAEEPTSDASASNEAAAAEGPAPTVAEAPTSRHRVQLGPLGEDEKGRPGRLHTVQKGDTLWDISDAYLGTPWVWPSIWTDNGTIDDPDRIYPGDILWITPHEMRKVTASEAAELIGLSEPPAALGDGMDGLEEPQIYRYTEIQSTGFVSADQIRGAASVLDAPGPRSWLTDHDKVVVGLGEGETQVGAQYDILRTSEQVTDPETGIFFGYHTEYLGWLEVTEVQPESSWAVIRLSRSEVQRGDRLLPRRLRTADIEVGASPDVSGHVVFTPNRRFEMGSTDIVYLNRGARDGLAVGSPLEIFRPLGSGTDEAKGQAVKLPDHVIAKLLVVDVTDESAAAVVTHTVTELSRGDRFRHTDTLSP